MCVQVPHQCIPESAVVDLLYLLSLVCHVAFDFVCFSGVLCFWSVNVSLCEGAALCGVFVQCMRE